MQPSNELSRILRGKIHDIDAHCPGWEYAKSSQSICALTGRLLAYRRRNWRIVLTLIAPISAHLSAAFTRPA